MICVLALLLDVSILASVLAEVGQALYDGEKLTTSDGKTYRVDKTFSDGLGRLVGLQKAGRGYKLVVDSHGLDAGQAKAQAESIHKIVQRYAKTKAVSELQRRGYSVAEQQDRPDGSIRVVVRRWS